MNQALPDRNLLSPARPVRLGFLGVGWIGRHRMKAILNTGAAEAVVIADPSPEMAAEARELAPAAELASGLDELLAHELDGIVIATPSAQHAEQSIRALRNGISVFCQKPLGRTAEEVRSVVEAARAADRLLAVDLSYRQTEAMRKIRGLIRSGEIGKIFAADLTFHNAYGPDKPWFYDKALSGGGCVMDLGVHLVDMALWSLDFPKVTHVQSHLMSGGNPLPADGDQVEDFAIATLVLEGGAIVRIACSWRLQAGREAVIGASFFGTNGGAAMRNVNGSFYDFKAERYQGTSTELLSGPPDAWGGRAASEWAMRLAAGETYDAACEKLVDVADVLDRIYRSTG
ncbi:Gfo/Idh/MocA family protein [Rhizobium sp. LCM 4573]|uniref:Gfo/Idh/MocA family protein n=1 Tax=Rhizobium sp. LCM 4573 TaxID=1848291 RepID=UPI0008D9BAF6|nr:Gfo/Idh/MocA family oxidoreductase [Rhizobium sp. LCM 4573]OHV84939.1 oxidoreductase [Rhizobium sp. LCM 4573]